jgi:hypothetical protein
MARKKSTMSENDPVIPATEPSVNPEPDEDELELDGEEEEEEETSEVSEADDAALIEAYYNKGDVSDALLAYLQSQPNGAALLARRIIPHRYLMHMNAIRRKVGDKTRECAIAALTENLTVGEFSPPSDASQWAKLQDYLHQLSEADVALLTEGHNILKSQYAALWLSQLPTRNQGYARIQFLRDVIMTPPELWDWFGGEVKLPAKATRKRKEAPAAEREAAALPAAT